jgi:acyl-CoA thioester hydrolase
MAKPPSIDISYIHALPRLQELVVPVEYRDENEHVNVRYYMTIFDEAGYPMISNLGLTPEFHVQHGTGGFDLEHHLHYLNEVLIGDRVAVYYRLLARSAKRIHYMMFLINETQQKLAATYECVNSFANLVERKTAPYPPEIAARIDAVLAQHQQLDWAAPVCGVMGA